jgi:7-cyano-7-deazaguanine synthase
MTTEARSPLILLYGGGIESAALLGRLLADGELVWPVYEHWGLHWDDCALMYARRSCEFHQSTNLLPLMEIQASQREVLANHWAVTGLNVPRSGDPPLAMEIPSRNLLLLAIAATRFRQLPELHFVLGTTADNKFSDGSRAFFDHCERVMTIDCRRPVAIKTPLITVSKHDVIRNANVATLSYSFSCVDPHDGLHCGICYKCGRRTQAFQQARVKDPTIYASEHTF